MLRVIAGKARGKKLKAPAGMNTRPVTDMIKEAIFNVLGQDMENYRFLDLFAGSGSMGIEALSRGAVQVIFIDRDSSSVRIIKENLANCGFSRENYQVYKNDVFKAVDLLEKKSEKFDFIYVDPPFTDEEIFDRIMSRLDQARLLTDEGILLLRTRRKKKLTEGLKHLIKYRMNEYGESTLHYYKWEEEASTL